MNIIEEERQTEYFAKKSCIDRAIEHFKENEGCYFVKLTALWGGGLDDVKGESEIVARREIVSQFYGVDFVKSKERNLSMLEPKNKEEYMELWDALQRHEPSNVKVMCGREIIKKVQENLNLGKKKKSKRNKRF